MKRKPISAQKRYSILERDHFSCQVCGASAPNVTLHVDHIVAVARGGSDKDSNLRAVCITCNLGKSSSAPAAPPPKPKPSVNYPIITSHNEVENLGEGLSTPIFWIGSQWAVTNAGIEARDGRYFIAAHRLWEDFPGWSWERHMAEKTWVERDDFNKAIGWAREHFAEMRPVQREAAE